MEGFADMHRFAAAAAGIALLAAGSTSFAQTVYPIDRAEILAGATFDFKVEFPGIVDPAKVSISVNGEDHAKAFGNTDFSWLSGSLVAGGLYFLLTRRAVRS
jgi:hypothetical protein